MSWWHRFSIDNSHSPSLISSARWEWDLLEEKCIETGTEEFYQKYTQLLSLSYINIFAFAYSIIIATHSIALLILTDNIISSGIDVLCYVICTIIVIQLLFLNFNKKLVERFRHTNLITSWIALTMMLISDFISPILFTFYYNEDVFPCYECTLIAAAFMFMPTSISQSVILSAYASSVYLFFYFVAERLGAAGVAYNFTETTGTLAEAVYLLCLNLMCFAIRLMRTIHLRLQCIDRKKCIQEDIILQEIKEKENRILLNVIPSNIADEILEDVRHRINWLKEMKRKKHTNFDPILVLLSSKYDNFTKNCYIKSHENVTILYGDLVNYSHLTSSLEVKALVETLHELFLKFDERTEKFKVQRIKFLGDCYYCVANVSLPNDQHAASCVEFGFTMIEDLNILNLKRKLNLKMRIGVHTGNVNCGVIGSRKWQFDIWSKDAEIANYLEQTGVPGYIHTSMQTLSLLEQDYIITEGTKEAREHEFLRKHDIRTFLLKKYVSIDITKVLKHYSTISAEQPRNFSEIQPFPTHEEMEDRVKIELTKTLDQIPLGVLKYCIPWGNEENITCFCLLFKNWKWDIKLWLQPDFLYKYSLNLGIFTTLGIMLLHIIYNSPETITIFDTNARYANEQALFWFISCLTFIIIISMTFVTWYQKIWLYYMWKPTLTRPLNGFSSLLFKYSVNAQSSILFRLSSYFLVVGLQLGPLIYLAYISTDEYKRYSIHDIEMNNLQYLNPDLLAQVTILNISTSFCFTFVPYPIKMLTSSTITGIFLIIYLKSYDSMSLKGIQVNAYLDPKYTYIIVVLLQYILFYIMYRHSIYLVKVNFIIKRALNARHEENTFMKDTIKILIRNILPLHICDVYLKRFSRTELYWEEYDDVAIMFATLINFNTETMSLQLFNEIICEFDEALKYHRGLFKIEKIKLSKWTYIAACGLGIARTRDRSVWSLPGQEDNISQDFNLFNRRETIATHVGFVDTERRNQDLHIVPIMTNFAIKLLKTMKAFNHIFMKRHSLEAKFEGVLRIGIASGPTMAGILGMDKLHYDIWGNAVNMAARMDETGVPGKIQVTKHIADILALYSMPCTYRGKIHVKGYGEQETYFVNVDDTLDVIDLSSNGSDESMWSNADID